MNNGINQLRQLRRKVVKINDNDHPVSRYGIITDTTSYSKSGYFLEEGLPTFNVLDKDRNIIITDYRIESLSVTQVHYLNTIEDMLNIWYQYTEEDPFDNVILEDSAIIVETVENTIAYPIHHIVAISRPFNYRKTVLTLSTGDEVSLYLKNKTYNALITIISGQSKSPTITL